MNDVYNLIKNINIKATPPKIIYNQPRISKTGRVTYPVVIRILTEKKNILNFLEKIKYTYCNRAIKKSEIILQKFKENK